MKKRKKSSNIFGVFAKGKSYLNMIYMLLLFPLGIISFVVLVTLLAISLAFIASPILVFFGPINIGSMVITSLTLRVLISLIFLVVGIFLLLASLYVFNGISWLIKQILKLFD